MKLALGLARRGLGQVWPNPAVGCIIVQRDQVVGRGWTQPGGRPHAETIALAQANERARGATVYVTLEPCAHHGKTPPCAKALIAAGVARVVVAITDPDPRVDGGGIALLQAAGITVETGVLAREAIQLNQGFLKRVTKGVPFVTLKLASSFDGRIATSTGESKWITGPEARKLVHAMRARHDAVMVGGGTARTDDPSLTVRDLGVARQPVRVVLSKQLDLPLTGKLAHSAREVPLWICHGAEADAGLRQVWRDIGATLIEIPALDGRQIDINTAMQALADKGLTRVFCEGGAGLSASLLRAKAVDELVGFTAGLAIGAEGLPAIAGLGTDRLSVAPRFELKQARRIGADVMHVWAKRA